MQHVYYKLFDWVRQLFEAEYTNVCGDFGFTYILTKNTLEHNYNPQNNLRKPNVENYILGTIFVHILKCGVKCLRKLFCFFNM